MQGIKHIAEFSILKKNPATEIKKGVLERVKENKTKEIKHNSAFQKIDLVKKLSFLLVIISFLVYANTLKNGYVLDDEMVVKKNTMVTQGIKAIPQLFSTPHMRGFLIIPNDLYRPLSLVMFAIEYQFFGLKPAVGHFFNILFFAGCVVVLFVFLDRFFERKKTIIAFITALLFAVHPIHTEVVANIKSSDELLCFFFAFLSMNFFINYMKQGKTAPLILGGLMLFLSYLSKETVIAFLVITPLLFFFYINDSRRRAIHITAATIMVTMVFLAIRFYVLDKYNANQHVPVELIDNPLVAAPDAVTRVATEMVVLGKYLKILFLPYPLISNYSFNSIPLYNFGSFSFWLSLIAYIFIIYIATTRWLKNKKDPWAFAIIFYLTTIFLFSNIPFLMGAEFAERFAFFASLSVCLAAALAIEKWILKADAVEIIMLKNKKVLAMLIPLTLAFSTLTIARNADWEDNYTLFSKDAERSPNDSRLHHHLAVAVNEIIIPSEPDREERRLWDDESFWQLKKAVEIYPDYGLALLDLGRAYDRRRLYDSAEQCFTKALALTPDDKSVTNNLGHLYYNTNRYEKALTCFKRTAQLSPDNKFSYFNLVLTYLKLKEYDSAILYGNKTLAFDPQSPDAHHAIAVAYYWKQNFDSAEYHYKKTVALLPGNVNALNDLGIFYFYAKRYLQAIEQFKKVIELDNRNTNAYASLGEVYFLTNQYEAAIDAFNKELVLDPKNGHNIHYIATAYQKLGKKDQALRYAAMAKQFNPDFKLQ